MTDQEALLVLVQLNASLMDAHDAFQQAKRPELAAIVKAAAIKANEALAKVTPAGMRAS